MKRLFSVLMIASAALTAQSAYSDNCSIHSVLNNPGTYLNKNVTLNGKVERVLGSDSFIMSSNDDSGQRILVMTSQSKLLPTAKQSAGISGENVPQLKDNQQVQVTGKLDMLNIKSETDTINPKKDSATFSEVTSHTPVVIVQPGQVHIAG